MYCTSFGWTNEKESLKHLYARENILKLDDFIEKEGEFMRRAVYRKSLW